MSGRRAFYWLLASSLMIQGISLIGRNSFFYVAGFSLLLYATIAWLFSIVTERIFFSKRLVIEREVKRNILYIEEETEVTLKISNNSPLRFSDVDICEEYDIRLQMDGGRWHGTLPPHSVIEIPYKTAALACGEVWLHGTRIRLRSADGLFAFERLFPCTSRLKVYPRLTSVGLKRRPVDRGSMLIGRYPRPVRGIGSEFSDLRSYLPGDPLRSIEWKASVRTGQLMVREFESEALVRSYFILDASTSMYEGKVGRRKIDQTLWMITCLIENFMREHDLVGLAAFRSDRGVYPRIPYGQGRSQLYRLLDFMVEMAQPPAVDVSGVSRFFLKQVWDYLKRIDPLNCRGDFNRKKSIPILARFVARSAGEEAADEFLRQPSRQVALLVEHCWEILIPLIQQSKRQPVNKSILLCDLIGQVLEDVKEDGSILIFSDLEGMNSPAREEPFIARCQLAQTHHQSVFVIAPFSPGFATGDVTPGGASAEMGRIVEAAYYSHAAYLRQDLMTKLQAIGVNVLSLYAPESLQVLMRRFEQIKLRKGGRR